MTYFKGLNLIEKVLKTFEQQEEATPPIMMTLMQWDNIVANKCFSFNKQKLSKISLTLEY